MTDFCDVLERVTKAVRLYAVVLLVWPLAVLASCVGALDGGSEATTEGAR